MGKFSGAVGNAAAAGSGDRFDKAAMQGVLISIAQPEERTIETKHGVSQAAVCKYIVSHEGDTDGDVWDDAAIFGAVIVPQLVKAEGPVIVGRIEKGKASSGRTAPWIFEDASEDEVATVISWWDENGDIDDDGNVKLPE